MEFEYSINLSFNNPHEEMNDIVQICQPLSRAHWFVLWLKGEQTNVWSSISIFLIKKVMTNMEILLETNLFPVRPPDMPETLE